MDLHYLLMAYGREEYQAEILMGYAMHVLHETPCLTRQAIRTSLSAIPAQQVSGAILPSAFQALAAADLANQIEVIKITPETLSVEELSKLWSAFQANHFRLTAGYQASVVLIESRKSTRATLPVLKSSLTVLPLPRPTIDEVVSSAGPPAMAELLPPRRFLIKGSGFRSERTAVRIGPATVELLAANVRDDEIAVDLSQPFWAASLESRRRRFSTTCFLENPCREHHIVVFPRMSFPSYFTRRSPFQPRPH
jgi:hypothetical protein